MWRGGSHAPLPLFVAPADKAPQFCGPHSPEAPEVYVVIRDT